MLNSYDVLRKSVPGFVRSEPILNLIYQRTGIELDRLHADVALMRSMVESITTCPDEGLWFWERLFGIDNPGLSPQNRRELLKMRCRGAGTLSKEFIASLVESFENGKVEVTDHPRDSTIEIRFISTIGTPPNIEDVRNALDDYLHAHYDIIFTLRYLMVREVLTKTIAQMESTLMDSFAFTKGSVNMMPLRSEKTEFDSDSLEIDTLAAIETMRCWGTVNIPRYASRMSMSQRPYPQTPIAIFDEFCLHGVLTDPCWPHYFTFYINGCQYIVTDQHFADSKSHPTGNVTDFRLTGSFTGKGWLCELAFLYCAKRALFHIDTNGADVLTSISFDRPGGYVGGQYTLYGK